MGNRAVITTEEKQIGVYLHWNGGRDSVEGFLTYCKMKGYRPPETDNYGWARLCQVIANYFGGEYSIGIDQYNKLDTDNGDNGVYIIKDWKIIGREFAPSFEQTTYTLKDMVEEINAHQPTSEQFDSETLQRELDNIIIQPIASKQIKAIHTLASKLELDHDDYQDLLEIMFEVTTCKDLTEKQASTFIDILNKLVEGEV